MTDTRLSRTERLILVNQFSIRKALEKTDEYDEIIEILSDGYEIFYGDAFNSIYSPTTEDECAFVVDVLDMYSAIEHYKNNASVAAKKEVDEAFFGQFRGFDGNNEGKHRSFAIFLMKKQSKFSELLKYEKNTDGFNSHSHTLETYSVMVQRWKALPTPIRYDLRQQQVKGILDAAAQR